MFSFITIPSTSGMLAEITTAATDMFTGLLPIALLIAGLIIAGVFVGAIVKGGVLKGAYKLVGSGKRGGGGGRRGRGR